MTVYVLSAADDEGALGSDVIIGIIDGVSGRQCQGPVLRLRGDHLGASGNRIFSDVRQVTMRER